MRCWYWLVPAPITCSVQLIQTRLLAGSSTGSLEKGLIIKILGSSQHCAGGLASTCLGQLKRGESSSSCCLLSIRETPRLEAPVYG